MNLFMLIFIILAFIQCYSICSSAANNVIILCDISIIRLAYLFTNSATAYVLSNRNLNNVSNDHRITNTNKRNKFTLQTSIIVSQFNIRIMRSFQRMPMWLLLMYITHRYYFHCISRCRTTCTWMKYSIITTHTHTYLAV
jgi:hypothetical protein